MLRDDGSDGGGRRRSPRNVLGEPLDICSIKPMTGFYRDGCCNTPGASVPLGGRKHSRQATRLVWSCVPLTKALSLTARLPILNALQ